ncbi:unnamed protein product [Adineta ricciae]|uniref:Uncharacterized protein n=1 Tax=Adineta ricciae TaxID=249248 RepID=A0A813YFI8_ADIRI|nr:unnamed protein product [Adineta ricciae]CAF0883494.1 unnamed protein product [Adineta ricciae]
MICLFIEGTNGYRIRHRRQQQQQPQQQQQSSASLYGNQYPAGSVPSAYNYGQNANLYGTGLNTQISKDQYGNAFGQQNPSNTMGMNNLQQQQQLQQQQLQQQQQQFQQQQQQQQSQQSQMYGVNVQSGTNPLLRNTNLVDSNGYLIPSGQSPSSQYQSSNPQMGYQPNPNQAIDNKNVYNQGVNANNNQYGYNANLYPNSNTYGGQVAAGNTNTWMSGQYGANTGNTWMQNRDQTNNNNINALTNPNSPYYYNDGHRLMTSYFILLCSFLAIFFFRM